MKRFYHGPTTSGLSLVVLAVLTMVLAAPAAR